MNELTDLELCKKIAEIECVDILWEQEVNDSNGETKAHLMETLMEVVERHSNGAWARCSEYNPLTNKALLFDLMVKYRVKFDYVECPAGTGKAYYAYTDGMKATDYKCTPERAILECIVEANQ